MFLIMFAALFLMSSKVFGVCELVIDDNNTVVNFTHYNTSIENCQYFCLFEISGYDGLRFYYSDQPFLLRNVIDTDDPVTFKYPLLFEFENTPTIFGYYTLLDYTYDEQTNTYTCSNNNGANTSVSYIESHNNCVPFEDSNVEFSSFTRLAGNSGFPLPLKEVLAPIVRETPLEEAMKEIVEILPVILLTIVGLISLSKGLRLLSTVFHRS